MTCPVCCGKTSERFPYNECDKCKLTFVFIWDVLYYWNSSETQWEIFYDKSYNPSKRRNKGIEKVHGCLQ